MIKRRAGQFIFIACASLLCVANLIVLLPPKWTLAHFIRWPVTMTDLALGHVPDEPESLFVMDYTPSATTGAFTAPSNSLERRRLKNFLEHARITVLVSDRGGNPVKRLGPFWARDVWSPDWASNRRFDLTDVLRLPAGTWRVRAVVFADPPHGMRENGQLSDDELYARVYRAAWPGAVFVETSWTDEVTFRVAEGSGVPDG